MTTKFLTASTGKAQIDKNTIAGKIAAEIENGYRLTYAELKQINEESIEQYMIMVAKKLVGLKKEDMVHLSSFQERTYKRLRISYFENKIINSPLGLEEFIILTDIDKRIFVKSLAGLKKRLPDFLKINDENRYWYTLWYAETNRVQINQRLKIYRAAKPRKENKYRSQQLIESKRKYLDTEKGRKRAGEYRRNCYRKKQLAAGKTVRPHIKNRQQFNKPSKKLFKRFFEFFKF